ncbi:MAG: IS91 family transposase [Bacilli bacterium]|nr:IS91 family transposase [Bacilli bacterium]MBQ7240780.1 IS91 family transposase [Bacilli bacterium]
MSKYMIRDIFKTFGPNYIKNHNLSKEEWKVYNAIINCGTSKLGYHICTCTECGEEYFGFNSCRNRHCPMCQNYAREKWIEKESSYLLDTKYFHIITTVPSELNEIAMYNKMIFYNILFKATSESILELANDPKWLGAKVGITSILHTWGQTMELHPHIHSIVTGGGLSNNKWLTCKEDYLFKVQVLGSLFKKKFLACLKHEFDNLKLNDNINNIKSFNKFLEPLYNKTWITYIEPPKGDATNVVEYVGRYSFRVAISNQRIKDISNDKVTFEYKDYKDNCKIKEMTITGEEFIRRFFLHILPNNFTKIKHYGLLANRDKKNCIKLCKLLISRTICNEFIVKKSREFKEFICEKCGNNKFYYSFEYNNNRLCTC